MPDTLHILLVDDDVNIRQTQPDAIREELKALGIAAEVTAADSVEDARRQLASAPFDCAIVDLYFEGQEGDGNDVLRAILDTRVLPVIVYSGHRDTLDQEFLDHGLIHCAEKKKAEYPVAQIHTWYRQRVFEFFTESGFLASGLRDVIQRTMWAHVSRYWSALEGVELPELERIAARLAATLVHDRLVSDPQHAQTGGEVCVHPAEVYILDTPREHLAVGDAIRLEEGLWIVLTPACDLVPRADGNANAERVLLARCSTLAEFAAQNGEFRNVLLGLLGTEKQKKSAAEKMDKLMRHAYLNDNGRRFFLPPFAMVSGGVVDFLDLKLGDYGAAARVALLQRREFSLNGQMAAELATRFARFMSRLGQAPYQSEAIVAGLIRIAEEVREQAE